ncbi:DUF2061 domain-containing protein [Pseudomonas sp. USHLN015]|uniref:DUF2061 domain-containing protein n=1 Tax=Pseudomonas sp. USHLN015 TaxID=3081296 RepID=UPI003FA72B6F
MRPALGGCCGVPANQPLVKTLTFAVLHFSIAFTVAYLLTGSLLTGGLIALIEPACNTVAFYFHERLWSRRGAQPARGYGHGNLMRAVESPRRRE